MMHKCVCIYRREEYNPRVTAAALLNHSTLYLMQLEAHSDRRSHHLLQEVKISKNPLVFGGNAEVAFKQGVETVQK